MFEPGDRVRINTPEEQGKVWTVLSYPWKCWHDMMVTVGDENGQEKTVNVADLTKVEDKPQPRHMACNGDFCEIVREEMRLE